MGPSETCKYTVGRKTLYYISGVSYTLQNEVTIRAMLTAGSKILRGPTKTVGPKLFDEMPQIRRQLNPKYLLLLYHISKW